MQAHTMPAEFIMLVSFVFPASLFFSASRIVVEVQDVENLKTDYEVEDELRYVRGFLVRWYYRRSLGLAITSVLRDLCGEPTAPVLEVRSIRDSTIGKIRTSYEGDTPT